MTWAPYFRVRDVEKFFAAMRGAIEAADDWQSPTVVTEEEGAFFWADYAGDRFRGEDLSLLLCAYTEEPGRVYFNMRARNWSDTMWPAGGEPAEHLALSLFETVRRTLRRKLKLVRPVYRPRPLRGAIQKALRSFACVFINRGSEPVSAIHPTDELRFLRFVRVAHQYSSTLRPDDVRYHLVREGFAADLADELAKHYEVARQTLAMHLDPWNLRAERGARRQRDREEYDRVFGGRATDATVG